MRTRMITATLLMLAAPTAAQETSDVPRGFREVSDVPPEPRPKARDRATLLGLLDGDRSKHATKLWAMEELVNMGDESVWSAINAELQQPEWDRENYEPLLRAKLDYSKDGHVLLLAALRDERHDISLWAAERIRVERRVGAMPGVRDFIAEVEREGREAARHGRASVEWGRFRSRWASVYTRAIVALRDVAGEDRITDDRVVRQLLTKHF